MSASALDRIPVWVQTTVAVLTLVLTVLIAYGLIRPITPSAAPGETTAPAPFVAITAMNPELNEIVGLGTFANVNLDRDAIFLIGQPKGDPESNWVTVRAQATTVSAALGLASGDWRAHRPGPGVGFFWRAVLLPSAFGAGGGLDDLRVNGPSTDGILAISEPFETN